MSSTNAVASDAMRWTLFKKAAQEGEKITGNIYNNCYHLYLCIWHQVILYLTAKSIKKLRSFDLKRLRPSSDSTSTGRIEESEIDQASKRCHILCYF